MNNKLLKIAQEVLDLDTLETRNSDHLDFHTYGVWSLKTALESAYKLGKQSVETKKTKDTP